MSAISLGHYFACQNLGRGQFRPRGFKQSLRVDDCADSQTTECNLSFQKVSHRFLSETFKGAIGNMAGILDESMNIMKHQYGLSALFSLTSGTVLKISRPYTTSQHFTSLLSLPAASCHPRSQTPRKSPPCHLQRRYEVLVWFPAVFAGELSSRWSEGVDNIQYAPLSHGVTSSTANWVNRSYK